MREIDWKKRLDVDTAVEIRNTESGLSVDYSAELHFNVKTLELDYTDDRLVEKDTRNCVGASNSDKIYLFVAEVAEVIVSVAAGRDEKPSLCIFNLLHSPIFDVEEVKKVFEEHCRLRGCL